MTTDSTSAAHPPRGPGFGRMLLTAVAPGLAVSLVCVIVGTIVSGAPGLWGAVVGAVVTAAFFALSVVVLSRTRRLDATLALGIAMSLYLAKVIVLIGLFLLLTRSGAVEGALDRATLGLTIIATTVAWTVGEMVAAVRNRQPVYDLGEGR